MPPPPFELSPGELTALTAYVWRFESHKIRRATKLVTDDRLHRLARPRAAGPIKAVAKAETPFRVSLVRTAKKQWIGRCTCSVGKDCVHALALAVALTSFAVAKAPSSKVMPAKPRPSKPKVSFPAQPAPAPPPDFPTDSLESLIRTALGRDPTPVESRYAKRVGELHRRASQHGSVTSEEIAALTIEGLLPPASVPRLVESRPWHEFPVAPADFLQAIAWAARRAKVRLPDFVGSIAEVAPRHPRLVDFWRESEARDWMRTLGNDLARAAERGEEAVRSEGVHEFRVVLGSEKPTLEWRFEGASEWKTASHAEFVAMAQTHLDSGLEVAPGAARIWNAVVEALRRDFSRPMSYTPAFGLLRIAHRLATRDDSKASFIASSGDPLLLPAEPLHWEVTPPASAEGTYVFELRNPGGGPVAGMIAAFDGQPAIVLTKTTLWTAPRIPGALDWAQPTAIPAAAVESEPGLRFLMSLKCELPAQIGSRIRRVPIHPVVRGSLMPGNEKPGIPERLRLEIDAHDPDGRTVERLLEKGWTVSIRHQPEPGHLVVIERAALGPMGAHLAKLGARWDLFASGWTARVTEDFPGRFAEWARGVPPGTVLELSPELEWVLREPIRADVTLECEAVGIDWFDLKAHVHAGETDLTTEELKLLLRGQGDYVRLAKKGWRRLEWRLTEDDERQLARLGIEPRELDAGSQRVHALQLADDATSRFFSREQAEAIRQRVQEIRSQARPAVPAALQASLRPYQVEGFQFLTYLSENQFGGVLADDMGLGKTVQALAWIAWLREKHGTSDATPRRVLIACPKSVVPNWKAEAGRFLPGFRVAVWSGEASTDMVGVLAECDALVVNYTQLRLLSDRIAAQEWLAVIADEAQAIKNPDSQTAQALRQIKTAHRLGLTGTPIENRLLDLWSLMAFAMPGALGPRARFQRTFGKATDPNTRRRLASRLRPFLLRRTKSQVARDLPPRIEEDIRCELEGVQKALYKAEYKKARAMLLKVQTNADLDSLRFHFLTSLLRLRQICCHPALVDRKHLAEPSAKVEALLDVLEPLLDEGQKVLVFSQFVGMLELLREIVRERGWKDFHLAGDTENRGELVDTFNAHVGAAVFLISLKAGGSGLNLASASYVVLFDPWWNPAVEAQAIDRTHRIGQVNTVIAYRLIATDSIEEKIREIQKQKQSLADDILGEERFAQGLTLEDLRVLFAED